MKLPCKPLIFSFENAFCLNSATDNDGQSFVRENEYLLSQNELTKSDEIVFSIVFTAICHFTSDDIKIMWDESFPAGMFSQVSSIPNVQKVNLLTFVEKTKSGLNPLASGEIYFDHQMAQKMKKFGSLKNR